MIAALIDMAHSEEQAKKENEPTEYTPPKYPYGLCVSLGDDELAKLGLEPDVTAGDGLQFFAMAKVTSVSAREEADGKVCRRVELQITHMALGPDHEEEMEGEV